MKKQRKEKGKKRKRKKERKKDLVFKNVFKNTKKMRASVWHVLVSWLVLVGQTYSFAETETIHRKKEPDGKISSSNQHFKVKTFFSISEKQYIVYVLGSL